MEFSRISLMVVLLVALGCTQIHAEDGFKETAASPEEDDFKDTAASPEEDLQANRVDTSEESNMDWFNNEIDVQQTGYHLSIPDDEMIRRIQSKLQVVADYLTDEEIDAFEALVERGKDPDLCRGPQEHRSRQKRQAVCDTTCAIACRKSQCDETGYRPKCTCNWWGYSSCSSQDCPPDPTPCGLITKCSTSCKKGSCEKTGYLSDCWCSWLKRPRCTAKRCIGGWLV